MNFNRFAAVPTIARVVAEDLGCEHEDDNGDDLACYDPMMRDALEGLNGLGGLKKLKKKMKGVIKKPIGMVTKTVKKAAVVVKRDLKKVSKPLVRDFRKAGKLMKTDFTKAGQMFGKKKKSGGNEDYAAVPVQSEEIEYRDENNNVITKEQYDAIVAANSTENDSYQSPPFASNSGQYNENEDENSSYENESFSEQASNAGPAIDYDDSNAEYEDLQPTYNEDENPAPIYEDGSPSYDNDDSMPITDEFVQHVPNSEMYADYGEPVFQEYDSGAQAYFAQPAFWNEWDGEAEALEGLGTLMDRKTLRPIFGIFHNPFGAPFANKILADKGGRMYRYNGAMLQRVGTVSGSGLEGWGSFRDKLAKTSKKVAGTITPSGLVYKYAIKKKPKNHKQFHQTKRTVTPYVAIAGAAVATIYTGGAAAPALIAAIGAAAAKGYQDVKTHQAKEDYKDAVREAEAEQDALNKAEDSMSEVQERYELEPEGGAAPGEIPGGDYANEYEGDGIEPDFFDIESIV